MFYSQVSSPLLRRITIQFPDDSVSDVTQNRFDKYFSGSELVVAGKVLPSDSNILTSYTTASAVSIMKTTMHLQHVTTTCENFPLNTPTWRSRSSYKIVLRLQVTDYYSNLAI